LGGGVTALTQLNMNNNNIPLSQLNDTLRLEAIKETMKGDKKLSPIDFIKEVSKKFIEKQIDSFPFLCEVTRMQNKLKWDELKEHGIKGKYTDSIGWSESREFKFDYEIPQELYLFMVNLVYYDFWSNDNEKIWRKFMKRICQGDDAMQVLMWVKMIYGSNSQKEIVTTS